MREILIVRENTKIASFVIAKIYLDGKVVEKVKNGETVKLRVDDESHKLAVLTNKEYGNFYYVKAGSETVKLNIYYIDSVFKFSNGTDYDDEYEKKHSNLLKFNMQTNNASAAYRPNLREYNNNKKKNNNNDSQAKSYLCGFFVSLALLIISYIIYANGEASTNGLLLALVFSILTGFFIILGGFWFIVIPLPLIFLWKTGCIKPDQSVGRKLGIGVLIFASAILVFVSLYTY